MRTTFDHDDSSATSPTVAAEDTPLLRSESSSVTARDASPTPSDSRDRQPGHGPAEQPPLGWKRATCIVLSMLVLIFLQGELILLSLLSLRP